MRRFLEKLAVMGERAAPVLWAVLCVLLCLALCLDAVWWRSLPLGVALLGLALLLSGGVGWMVGAEKLRTRGSNPIFWCVALPYLILSVVAWSTVWYLKYPGTTFVPDALLWIGFSYGLAWVLAAAFTVRWLHRQLGWTRLTFWGLGCLALIPVWQFGLFAAEFLGWELIRLYIARVGLVAIFLSGLVWTIWLVDIKALRIQARRLKEEPLDSSETVLQTTITVQPVGQSASPTDHSAGFRANTPTEEIAHAHRTLKVMAVLMGILAVCPIYIMDRFIFPNFVILFGGNVAMLDAGIIELKIFAAYPFLMCICLAVFLTDVLKGRRVERGLWLMGVSLLPVMAGLSVMGSTIGSMGAGVGPGVGALLDDLTGFIILLSIGWLGLITGGLIRYYRPDSGVGFFVAATGAVCTVLCWLIPVAGTMPLFGIFQIWEIPSEALNSTYKLIIFIGALAYCGLQIAASVFTFMALPIHSQQRQANAGLRAFQLATASLTVLLLAMIIGVLFVLLNDFSLGGLLTMGTILILGISSVVSQNFILPLAIADLFIGWHDEQASRPATATQKPVLAAAKTRPFNRVFIFALLLGPFGVDRFYTGRSKLGVLKLFGLGTLAGCCCFLIYQAASAAEVASLTGYVEFLINGPYEAYNGDSMSLVIMGIICLLLIGWLVDVLQLTTGRYRDGNGQTVLVTPWRARVLCDMGPLEAMNLSLTQGRRHIANPFDLDAWYYGRTQQKLKQSLNTTASYTVAFVFIALLLMLLPGCVDIFESPAGGGKPQQKRKKMIVQPVKKKVYVVNPFSAILFNPDIERIQLKLKELTKHLYEVGQGKGKGAGFAGGTRRGMVRFVRIKYSSGDWDQDLDLNSDLNLLVWYAANTGHKTAKKPEVRTVRQLAGSPVGKSPPLVYLTGQRSLSLSRSEIETLREYLTTKHGMLFADNGGSSGWHTQFFNLMRQVLPRTDPRRVPLDHPVHDGMDSLPIVAPHGGDKAYMWVVENRIVAYYHPGDIGDAWADGHAGVPRSVWENGYRLGGNIILYAYSEYSKWLQLQKKKD